MPDAPDSAPESVRVAVEIMKRGGWAGVDLFFALSGFLVGRIILVSARKPGPFAIRFLVRRGFKIYPPFYAFVGVATVALLAGMAGPEVTGPRLASEMFFLRNYLDGLFQQTWSLSVEEHFYFLLATTIVLARPFLNDDVRHSRFVRTCVAAVAVTAPLALRMVATEPFSMETSLFPTHLRVDSLAWGVIGAWVVVRHPRWTSRLPFGLLLAGAGLVYCLPFVLPLETSWFMPRLGLTLLAIGGVAAAIATDRVPYSLEEGALTRLATSVGRDSYAIYLWHTLCLAVCHKILLTLGSPGSFAGWAATVASYAFASIVAGRVMTGAIESPALAMRDRLVR